MQTYFTSMNILLHEKSVEVVQGLTLGSVGKVADVSKTHFFQTPPSLNQQNNFDKFCTKSGSQDGIYCDCATKGLNFKMLHQKAFVLKKGTFLDQL